MAFLEVRDLVLHYATGGEPVRAVDSVSFGIDIPGQALGIIGETGSGKSSLVLSLTRVLPSNVETYSGNVFLEGSDIMSLSNDRFRREIRWRRIAVVFQGAMNGFNPVTRVGKQLAERLVMDGLSVSAAREKIESLLESVGLSKSTYDRFPHELSGGMKQRAAIAMALSLEPSLLILDEPTSALDVSVQAQIMNVLKRLKWERGISMIFITHDIALASDLSDRVAVMYAGQVREEGPIDSILNDPRDPYTRELMANVPRLRGGARPVSGGGSRSETAAGQLSGGCRFRHRCTLAFEPCGVDPGAFEVDEGHTVRCWRFSPGRGR